MRVLKKGVSLLLTSALAFSMMPSGAVSALAQESVSLGAATLDGVYQSGAFSANNGYGFVNKYYADGKLASVEDVIYDGLVNHRSSINISIYHLSSSEIKSIYQDVINENADLFYVSTAYSYQYIGSVVTAIVPQYTMDEEEAAEARKTFDSEMQKILDHVDDGWSDLEKAMYLHDYLCTHFEYDLTYSIYDSYHFLTKKTGVCQAYTLTYGYLLKQFGIENTVAESDSMNHIWNVIKINGNWYHVDVTWDDPTADMTGRARHLNFLKSDTGIVNASSNQHYDWTSDQTCSSTAYDTAFWDSVYTPFVCENDVWYCLDKSSGEIKSCDLDEMKELETVYQIFDYWYVLPNKTSCWRETYSGLGAYDGKLYFNMSTAIYSFDIATGQIGSVLSLDDPDASNIYSCYMDEEVIYYATGTTPNQKLSVSGTVTVPKKVEPETETTEAEVVLSVSTDRKNVRPGDKITLTVSVDQFRSRRSDDTDREFGLLVIPGKVVNVFECHVSLDQATVIEDSIQPLVYEPSYAQLDNTVGVSEVTPSVKNHINYIEETDSPVALFTLQVIAPEGIAENQILHFDFVDTVIAKNMNAEETYTVKTVGAEVKVCAEEIFVNDGDMTLEVDEDTDVLKGIRAGMTAEQLGNSCNYTVEVYQGTEGEAAESSAVIRTGDIVKLFDAEGREVYSYTACVKGDVSGDGKIDVLDMEKIQKSILNLQVLDGVYEQAGMLTEGSTRLSVMDMEVIQKNILGIEKI